MVFYREGWLFFCNQRTSFFLDAFHVDWRVGKVPKEERKENKNQAQHKSIVVYLRAPPRALSLARWLPTARWHSGDYFRL